MSQYASHLTRAQIEAFAAQAAELRLDAAAQRSMGHISECPECLGSFLQACQGHLRFPAAPAAATPACLTDDELKRMAAGLDQPPAAGRALEHVPFCAHCGPLLRQYVRDFSDDISDEGRQLLALTKSATAEWQAEVVKKIVRQGIFSRVLSKVRSLWSEFTTAPLMVRVAAPALAVVLAVAGVIQLRPQISLYMAGRASINAFSDTGQRTVAMRLPGAAYAPYEPLPALMGDATQEPSLRSPALFDAKSAVARVRQSGAMDSRWREIDGRAALAEGTAGGAARAVDALEKVIAEGHSAPRVKIELAAAYFERDSRADKPNLAKTIDLLEGVLATKDASREERATALFNVALAYEKINAWQLVYDRLEEELKLDPSSPWAEEARSHRDKAKTKLPPPRPQGYRTPSFFFFIAAIPASSSR